MIIKGPTGLFKKSLPALPEDNRSITFTISNKNPPPTRGFFVPKIPNSVVSRPLPIPENRVLDSADRRNLFGQRIKSIVSGGQIHTRDGKKLFEPGESIEFTEDSVSVESRLSLDEVVISHNTNILDLKDAGLTDEEIQQIENDAERSREEVRNQIANKQSEIDIQSSTLSKLQRKINELMKILNSLIVIYNLNGSYPSGNEKYDRIYNNLEQANSEKDSTIESINTLNKEIVVLKDKLVRISEVVR